MPYNIIPQRVQRHYNINSNIYFVQASCRRRVVAVSSLCRRSDRGRHSQVAACFIVRRRRCILINPLSSRASSAGTAPTNYGGLPLFGLSALYLLENYLCIIVAYVIAIILHLYQTQNMKLESKYLLKSNHLNIR